MEQTEIKITREEWLRHAVEALDAKLFAGGLELLKTNYQIGCGWTKKNKIAECIFPYDGADVQIDEFFPNTINVNFQVADPIQMLTGLAHACLQCFYGIRTCNGKQFKTLAESFYFDAPFNKPNASPYLIDILKDVHKSLVQQYGEFPGKAIVIHKKEAKKGKSNKIVLFCEKCGYEISTTKKVWEKYEKKAPICPCGQQMIQDVEDEDSENQDTEG